MPENLFQKGEGIQRIKTVYMLIGKRKNGILEIWNDGRMKISCHRKLYVREENRINLNEKEIKGIKSNSPTAPHPIHSQCRHYSYRHILYIQPGLKQYSPELLHPKH